MNSLTTFSTIAKQMAIMSVIAVFMLLTRGSHTLTPFNLPDASIVLFLLGGLLLKRAGWFVALFTLATCIDFGAAALDPTQGFCLTNGYWGLIPSYGVMWLGGLWLSKKQDAFAPLPYALISTLTTLVAFAISTQTYYLFSGHFPAQGLIESMKHGWEYLPSWMGFAGMYFAIVWLGAALFRSIIALRIAKA
jgi:hypothetical protein